MAKKITEELVWQLLPQRKADSHKGSYGKVLCVAGSTHYRGAAALCVEGLLRAGAGLVRLASVEPVLSAVSARLPECMYLPCAASVQGGIDKKNLSALQQASNGCNTLVVGCGMGNTPHTVSLVQGLLQHAQGSVVVDADGLNALAQLPSFPRLAQAQLVLTPHVGEMARLCAGTVEEISANRESVAVNFARAHGCVVVLKGHQTLVAAPGGQVYQNTTGNPGLARGGSGDALAGILGALLAQGLSPLEASICAVWLHGKAADLAAQERGQMGMLPQDLFAQLGALFAQNDR